MTTAAAHAQDLSFDELVADAARDERVAESAADIAQPAGEEAIELDRLQMQADCDA